MEFQMGEKVEVIGHDEGFEGSYYAAKVISREGRNQYKVEYESLLAEDESGPLQEVVDSFYLRPVPPEAPQTNYSLEEMVDGYENDGWWLGFIEGKFGSDYFVYFPTTEEEKPLPLEKLRIHLEWSNSKRKWKPCGVYKQRMRNTGHGSGGFGGGDGDGSSSSSSNV